MGTAPRSRSLYHRLHSISRRDRVRTGAFPATTERTLPVSADLGTGVLNFPPLSQVHHEAASN